MNLYPVPVPHGASAFIRSASSIVVLLSSRPHAALPATVHDTFVSPHDVSREFIAGWSTEVVPKECQPHSLSTNMAAALKHFAHAHPIHGSKRNSKPPPVNEEQRDKEKRFILDFESHTLSAEPNQNNVDIKRTQLGTSSKQLRLQDFELVKTLGTGICCLNTTRRSPKLCA